MSRVTDGVTLAGFWSKGKRPRVLLPHHNDGLEMVLVTKGRVHWRIEDRNIESGPGTVSFTLPWQEHGGAEPVLPGNELYYVVLALDRRYATPPHSFGFHASLGVPRGVALDAAKALLRPRRQVLTASDSLSWFIQRIVHERCAANWGAPTLVAALGCCALIELARLLKGGDHYLRDDRGSAARVRAFAGTLAERCDEPWTLDAMAEACALGRTRFADLFERETGDSPSVGLRRARVRAAERLLRETTDSITAIGLNVGFSSGQHFADVFREFTGQTPSAFRQAATTRRSRPSRG